MKRVPPWSAVVAVPVVAVSVVAVSVLAVSVAVLGTSAAGGLPAARGEVAPAKKLSGTLTVSAAASLTEAFTKLGADFEAANPGTSITFNFAASSALVTQIQGGAPADVFASADGTNMQKLVSGGQVIAEPAVFAANDLAIVVKPGNPKHVKSLADLAKLDVVSRCADAVPCGRYATQALVGAGVTIPSGRTTKGADVKATLSAVSTGDADAAIVYSTDAKAAGTSVQVVAIPAWLNLYVVYPIAPIAASDDADLARAFVRYTMSLPGRTTLRSFGFLAPPLR